MRLYVEGLSNFGGKLEDYDDYEGARLRRRCRDFLQTKLYDIAKKEVHEDLSSDTSHYYTACDNINSILDLYLPNIDQSSPRTLKMWTSGEARVKGKKARVAMKTGRALKLMFPSLTDVEVEAITVELRNKLFPRNYLVKRGKSRLDFKTAYTGPKPDYEELDTSWRIKHIANSCMRHDFASQPSHPVEAYASGDFEIVWLENDQGQVFARCIVSSGTSQRYAGPIYAVNQNAARQLEAIADSEEWSWADGGEWNGLKLLALPYGGGYQAPYLDVSPRNLAVQDEDFLVIDRYGDIDASSYNGILFESSRHMCCNCEEPVDECDIYHYDGDSYCSDCYHDNYFTCQYCEEAAPNDEANIVMTDGGYGQIEETWCDCCCQRSAEEDLNGELWRSEDLVDGIDSDGYDCRISLREAHNNWFFCYLDSVYYHNDEAQELDNGELASMRGINSFNRLDKEYHIIWVEEENHWAMVLREQEDRDCA